MDLLGVLLGKTESVDKTEDICSLFDDCPYSLINVVKDELMVVLFSLTENHRWWLEEVEKQPENTLGLSSAEVFFSEDIGTVPRKVESREETPCGTDCKRCKFYLKRCEGCTSVFG